MSGVKHNAGQWLSHALSELAADPSHPAQVALRTYTLSLSLSLGPALIPFLTALLSQKKRSKATLRALVGLMKRELAYDGFAFSMTTAVAGATVLRSLYTNHVVSEVRKHDASSRVEVLQEGWLGQVDRLRRWLVSLNLTPRQVTFLANILSSTAAVVLLQKGAAKAMSGAGKAKAKTASNQRLVDASRPSPTLDLTLLLVIRALDSLVQSAILRSTQPKVISVPSAAGGVESILLVQDKLEREEAKRVNKERQKMTEKVDAFLFWVCSSRYVSH